MGRRAKGPVLDGTEPVEGIDTEGRLFFEKPILALVGKAVEEPRTTYSFPSQRIPPGDNVDPRALTGPMRLASSRTYTICVEPPKEKTYALSLLPTFDQVREYLKQMRVHGFGTGAIVTRKHQQEWRYTSVNKWGIIEWERGNPTPNQHYAPYKVKWFEKHDGFEEEMAWAEDLILIHTHLDNTYLKDIMISQGIEFKLSGSRSDSNV